MESLTKIARMDSFLLQLNVHFKCPGFYCIPWKYVCDGNWQCPGGMEEMNCPMISCPGQYQCRNSSICLHMSSLCDDVDDCPFQDDEFIGEDFMCKVKFPQCPHECLCLYFSIVCQGLSLNCDKFACPSHFKCPKTYCIPVRHLCDGETDCPDGDDEAKCKNYLCPGFFYCPVERLCLSFIDVCDGYKHCLETGDDELLCDLPDFYVCPTACFCVGYFIDCVDASLSRININMENVFTLILRKNKISYFLLGRFHPFLLHLDLSFNDLSSISPTLFKQAPVLLYFNINSNKLNKVEKRTFQNATLVRFIDFSGNPLNLLQPLTFIGLDSVPRLHISHTGLSRLSNNAFLGLNNLHTLSLVNNSIEVIDNDVFSNLSHLLFLFIQQNNIIALEMLHFSEVKLKLIILTNQYGFCCKVYQTSKTVCTENVSPAGFCVSNIWPPIWYIFITVMLVIHIIHMTVRFHKDYQNSISIFLSNYSVSHVVLMCHYAFRIILKAGQYTITDFSTFNLCLMSAVTFIIGLFNEIAFKLVFVIYRAYIIESIHFEESRRAAMCWSMLVWVFNTGDAFLFVNFTTPIREYCFPFSPLKNIIGLIILLCITTVLRTVDIVTTILSTLKVIRKRVAASRDETQEEKELRIRNIIDIVFTVLCHFAMVGLLLALTLSNSKLGEFVFAFDTVIITKSLVTVTLLTFATRTFKDVMTSCFKSSIKKTQNPSQTNCPNSNPNQKRKCTQNQIPTIRPPLLQL